MKRTERNIEDMLERSLPSLSEEQLESARERIFNSVRASAVAGGEELAEKPVTEFDSARRPGWRRFAFLGAAAAALIASIWIGASWQNGVYARLETADGSLYRVSEKETAPVRAGERIEAQEIVRSNGGGAGTILALADGSRVEMRSESELLLEHVDDGVRIHLRKGGIIVNAAKQRVGRHLYVQTKDVSVSVLGTVFLVNAEEEGSRVGVIQGEVHVQRGTTSTKIYQGEEIATNPTMQSIPVIEEIRWSRNAAMHLAQLQQSLTRLQQSDLFAMTGSQSPGAAETFELASVRPSSPRPDVPGECGWRTLQVDPARFIIDAPLYFIVALAYEREKSCRVVSATERISSVPGWMRAEWFEIQATIPPGSANYTRLQVVNGEAPKLQMMIQTLLADRFKLALHRELREMPVYTLTLGKGGPKFIDWTDEDIRLRGYLDPPGIGLSKIGGRKASMTNLADAIANATSRPVIDRTGLTGEFNYIVDYVPVNKNGFFDVPGPSIFAAIEEQLGLKLEAARAPVEVLVIDHVEKPSEN